MKHMYGCVFYIHAICFFDMCMKRFQMNLFVAMPPHNHPKCPEYLFTGLVAWKIYVGNHCFNQQNIGVSQVDVPTLQDLSMLEFDAFSHSSGIACCARDHRHSWRLAIHLWDLPQVPPVVRAFLGVQDVNKDG